MTFRRPRVAIIRSVEVNVKICYIERRFRWEEKMQIVTKVTLLYHGAGICSGLWVFATGTWLATLSPIYFVAMLVLVFLALGFLLLVNFIVEEATLTQTQELCEAGYL
jgi:hypothetical protein